MSRQSINTPIVYNNVLTHAQALMQFHDTNPVLDSASHKRLKIQFNEKPIASKKDSTPDILKTIHN